MKPIFQAASDIRSAETADEAFQVALLYLSSSDAKTADSSQAGTFLANVKSAFAAHNAPDQYKMLLTMALTLKNTSLDLKTSVSHALATHVDTQARAEYEEEATPVLLRNAATLKAVKGPKSSEFKFAPHFGGAAIPESVPAYPELIPVQNARELKLAINRVLLEQDITEQKAERFFSEVVAAFDALKLSSEEREDLITFIQEGTSSLSVLMELTDTYINQLPSQFNGSTPAAAQTRGPNFTPE